MHQYWFRWQKVSPENERHLMVLQTGQYAPAKILRYDAEPFLSKKHSEKAFTSRLLMVCKLFNISYFSVVVCCSHCSHFLLNNSTLYKKMSSILRRRSMAAATSTLEARSGNQETFVLMRTFHVNCLLSPYR